MSRLFALFAAIVLALSAASASVAAPPVTSHVNHFVGNFDLLSWSGTVVGRVVVDIEEPTESRLVSGTLDIEWNLYDPADPPTSFTFMDLGGAPVRESHAQLAGGWFYDEVVQGAWGYSQTAGTSGYLCDYAGPAIMGCRPFSVVFVQSSNPDEPRWVGWQFGEDPDYHGRDMTPGKGAWALTYSRDTNTLAD
jgi:hypothetical protein